MLLKVQVNGSIEDRGGIVGDAQQVHNGIFPAFSKTVKIVS